MTCITGMVRNGHVYMAGDLMGSNGFTGKVYPDSKVFVNGDFIIGYTSSFRMGQILEWNWNQPLRQEGISDREYMQLNVVESLRETFAAFGYGVKDGLEDIGGNFLIGYKDKLYEMQNNFSLLSIEDFAAVGSGSYHAEAILHVLYENEEIHPFEIMETAIGTAAHFTQSVSRECTVFSTDEEANEAWQAFYLNKKMNHSTPKKILKINLKKKS
ncbi:putative nucleophile aminohydrolase [Vibrio phage vB_VpaM_R16F]|nr:putative nucleophile aminohydrolase [Vibrio phage vB_VpaM_R16F]